MPDTLKDTLDTTMKMVNFVKARPLNSRVSSAICNDMGNGHVTLLQHTEVHWLSRALVLTRFFLLRDELNYAGTFPKRMTTNNCIRYPFHALPPVHLPIFEQESLIEIATSGFV
jgi:hypothetical protein